MKFLVLFLGSTTLVAGGTAITPQQDVHTDVSQLLTHQPANTRMSGDDCPWVETPIFDTVAHPLVSNNMCGWVHHPEIGGVDLDGDGIPESMLSNKVVHDPPEFSSPAIKTSYIPNSSPPEIRHEIFLSIDPKYLTYEGSNPYRTKLIGYLDVTNDGKLDAIIASSSLNLWWYVENISIPPAACASDLNNDGAVEVNDLMQIISNWGPCE